MISRRFRRRWTGCLCNGGSTIFHMEGRDLKTVVCQVSVWPPQADIYLADAAAIKVRDIFLEVDLFYLLSVYRRWQVLALGFPNLLDYIRYCQFLDGTSCPQMGRNGKGTGQSSLQPSRRYVTVVDVYHFLNATLREILD
jgi:hypothetical protein